MAFATGSPQAVFCDAPAGCSQPVLATRADHAAVAIFLKAVFHAPSAEEFQASLDDPSYAPHDRLLIKRQGKIVAHAQLAWRTRCFGEARLPICRLQWVGTLPEYAVENLLEVLVRAAELQAARRKAVLLEVADTHLSGRLTSDWTNSGLKAVSESCPRTILPRVVPASSFQQNGHAENGHAENGYAEHGHAEEEEPVQNGRPRLTVRHWRHFELSDVMRIYDENLRGTTGMLERSENYWRWLVGRKAYDRFYVAVDGLDGLGFGENGPSIVGYAVMRGNDILEMHAEPGRTDAARALLRRACYEAIERDQHTLRLHAPPGSSLHEWMQPPGSNGRGRVSASSSTTFLKIAQSQDLVCAMASELARRAAAEHVRLPCELGFASGKTKWQLVLEAAGATVASGRTGRSYLSGDPDAQTRLLLGYTDAETAMLRNEIRPSTTLAADIATALFPPVSSWRSPWDDLPAD